MPRSIYTKLTARNRSLTGYTQLWLAPDHLLLLTSTRIAEEYKRFSFSDIQSIVVTQLPPQVVVQVILILAAFAWMSLWFAVDIAFFKYTLVLTGWLALMWAITDIARGPRCRCYLHTRVSGELLAPVSRMNTAGKFLAAVRPRIEAAQGVLPVEDLAAIANSAPAWETPPPEIVNSPGYLPEIVFGTFLLNAILLWSALQFPKVAEITGLLMSTLFAEALLIVVALVRRRGRDERVIVYVVVALAILGVGFDIVTFGGEFIGWYMKVLERTKNGDRTITPMTMIPSGGTRVLIACAWRVAAAAIGLVAAFAERWRK